MLFAWLGGKIFAFFDNSHKKIKFERTSLFILRCIEFENMLYFSEIGVEKKFNLKTNNSRYICVRYSVCKKGEKYGIV
jgi:hypothetical protein